MAMNRHDDTSPPLHPEICHTLSQLEAHIVLLKSVLIGYRALVGNILRLKQ
jgi:hypothetical protein